MGELASPGRASSFAAAALLHQPTYMDILPQYIVYLVVAPPLVYLVLHGRWALVATLSAVCWLAVQLGLILPIGAAVDDLLGSWDEGLAMRNHFNVFAWQIVFMSGMILGVMTSMRQIEWRNVFRPDRRAAVIAALAFSLFFLLFRMSWTFGVLPEVVWDRFVAITNRGEFSLIYLLNFMASGYLLAWLLIAGPHAAENWVRGIADLLTRLFSLSFLRLIGRHSLQVYVFHVVVVYVVMALDKHYGPFSELARTMIALLAIASLAIPAWLRENDLRTVLRRSTPTGGPTPAGS
jgi:hypothetical protein